MRIVFAGNPEPAVQTLIALRQEHSVEAVITSIPKPQGRNHTSIHSAVATYALEHGIPLIETSNINTDERLKHLNYDIGVVVAFGQLIGANLLARSPWVNVHYSLLPRWRGASPVQYALMYGDDITGVTTFFLETQLDAGPIIAQATYMPRPEETGTSLLKELTKMGSTLAVQSLRIIENSSINAKSQTDEITYAPKITAEDCRIDWTQSAIAIDRKVRALFDRPTAFTTLRTKRIQLGPTEISAVASDGQPGSLVEKEKSIYVCTGSVDLCLGKVKPEGKNWMDARDWWRGLHDNENLVFE